MFFSINGRLFGKNNLGQEYKFFPENKKMKYFTKVQIP